MIDWQSIGESASKRLSQYLSIDSTNPPGDETKTADFISAKLRDIKIEPEVFFSAPKRANVLARLKGDGSKSPLLLLHHMDVVPAFPEKWSVPPFGGSIIDGYIYGRGALDMKSFGIMHLGALELLLKNSFPLKRDIIFLAVADEEVTGEYGCEWMVENHWDKLNPGIVWDEGGFGFTGITGGKPVFMTAVTEKKTIWPTINSEGKSGHSSFEDKKNPVENLVNALAKIQKLQLPFRISKVSFEMYKRLAPEMHFPLSLLYKYAHLPLIQNIIKKKSEGLPLLNVIGQNLITVTGISAKSKNNVIPDNAEASLDIRLLYDEDENKFIENLLNLLKNDKVKIDASMVMASSRVSSWKNDFFRSFEEILQTHVPGCVVTPIQSPASTDSRVFRQKGVEAYGLIPIVIEASELSRIHSVDERISEKNLLMGTQIVYEMLLKTCT